MKAIERLQPYDGRLGLRESRGHPLVIAKALADADKHRVLATTYAQIRFTPLQWEWDEAATGNGEFEQVRPQLPHPLVDGAEVARIKFQTGNADAAVTIRHVPEVDLLFNTDQGPVRHRHIRTIPWWLENLGVFGLSSLFDQDRYIEPDNGWRKWWVHAASTKRGLQKPRYSY